MTTELRDDWFDALWILYKRYSTATQLPSLSKNIIQLIGSHAFWAWTNCRYIDFKRHRYSILFPSKTRIDRLKFQISKLILLNVVFSSHSAAVNLVRTTGNVCHGMMRTAMIVFAKQDWWERTVKQVRNGFSSFGSPCSIPWPARLMSVMFQNIS